ncbi:MAG: PAS domain S-box protein [Candidatus Heimdallarchaeota archaeon]
MCPKNNKECFAKKKSQVQKKSIDKKSKNKNSINLMLENRYKNLFELTNDALFIISIDGIYLEVNQRASEILGYSIDELIGKSAFEFIASEDNSNAKNVLASLQQGKAFSLYERKFKRKNGEVFPAEINVSVVFDNDGKPAYIQSAVRDISGRKKIKSEQKRSEEKYRALFMLANDGIVVIDAETGIIVDANPEFERQTGRSKTELEKFRIWELRPLEQQDIAKEKFYEIVNMGAGFARNLNLMRPDDKITPIDFTSKVIKIHDKKYIESISRDISDFKQAEELLHKQKDELESFASTVAHDISGKLQVISLYNELISDSIYTEKISEQINDIVKFLNDLLFLAKEGEIIGKLESVNLNRMMVNIVEKVLALQPTLEIKISNLPTIKADPQKLEQVFENLIMNVVKHAKATELEIYSKKEKDELFIYVKDNGLGMTKDMQEKIKRSWETNKYSTLGLMIAKKIVDAHKGKISFESEEGKGTLFVILFPK